MAARSGMERVARAIETLKKASHKDPRAPVLTAIGKLTSVSSLLNLSSTNKVLGQLTDVFDDLQGLYAAFPAPMSRFCAAVLAFIFAEKIEPGGDFAAQLAWENVMKYIVSRALDFIEQNPSESNKTASGTALHSTLCDVFHPQGPLFRWINPALVMNVNFLLAEMAADHPENQSRLRLDKVLGAARIGSAISQSKDFFALDSLVALVGVILPPRQIAAKRLEFIDAVFTPTLFSCSHQIKRLIAASSSTDWDPVTTQIINELARSDISFPQPFYVTALRTSTPVPSIVDPLYVDRMGLFANIEQDDGMFSSVQIQFNSMEGIKLSAPGAFTTPVSVQLTSAPLIGSASPLNLKQTCSVTFQLKNADAAKFVDTIKARGMGKLINEIDRKVSKNAEGLTLDFDPSRRRPATQEEKVAKVEQLWKSNGDSGLCDPTSPLQPPRDSSAAHSDPRSHDALYADELSDVSDAEKPASKVKFAAPTKAKSSPSRPRVRIILDSDDEDAAAAPKADTARPRKSTMKRRAVEFDEEEEAPTQSPPSTNTMDEDFAPTQPGSPDAGPARVTRGAAAKKNLTLAVPADEPRKVGSQRAKASHDAPATDVSEPVRSIRRPANAKRGVPVEEHLSEDEIEVIEVLTSKSKPSSKSEHATKNKSAITRKAVNEKNAAKRAKVDEDHDVSDEAADRRPLKRQRKTNPAPNPALEDSPPPVVPPRRTSAAVFGARSVNLAPVKKRYGGRKGRTSSPAPSDADDTAMAIDYDELPAPRSWSPEPIPIPRKVVKTAKPEPAAADTRKSRVTAMKGKAGQPLRKTEPARKAPAKPRKVASPEKENTKAQTGVAKQDEEKEYDEAGSESEGKPMRRSTRAAKNDTVVKPAEPIVDATIPKPRAKPQKPKKAPWEEMHLKKDNAIPNSDEPPREIPKNDAVVNSDEPQTEMELDRNKVPIESDSYEEYYRPNSDPPPIADDDVTMIDLIQDAPKAKTLQHNLQAVTLPDLRPIDLTSPSPKIKVTNKIKVINPLLKVKSKPAPVTLRSPKVMDVNIATRQQARTSPIAASDSAPPLPMTKFKSEVLFFQNLPTPSPVRPSKLPTPPPAKRLSPLRPVRATKTSTPPPPPPPARPASSTPPRRSRAPPTSRQIAAQNDSPFPQRVYQTVAFAPSRSSPSPSARSNGQFVPAGRTTKKHEHTPELGRPGRAQFGRGQHNHEVARRDNDHKRSKSPMQGILEILNEIQEVVVEKISQRFEHVKKDVRLGRDGILRRAAANLEAMCAESEGHFNTLVDIEEEYAGYHRKIMLGIDDMHKSSEVMANALGQIIQHHDRRSLSKKLPTKLFTLPAIVRNPVLPL
ncbi:hypothetical protein B0H15DRAFT_962872 [Mycena belliarum]|uniref:Uncharacterized protein n=1 Tax=Mycena belliarum TaxID=1033014 RepID=A0AAD6UC29_9AGAR|nr:hypothetical protein B0H15DRAFT_962872 [Mycena belliae]